MCKWHFTPIGMGNFIREYPWKAPATQGFEQNCFRSQSSQPIQKRHQSYATVRRFVFRKNRSWQVFLKSFYDQCNQRILKSWGVENIDWNNSNFEGTPFKCAMDEPSFRTNHRWLRNSCTSEKNITTYWEGLRNIVRSTGLDLNLHTFVTFVTGTESYQGGNIGIIERVKDVWGCLTIRLGLWSIRFWIDPDKISPRNLHLQPRGRASSSSSSSFLHLYTATSI
jgi:hypothetical protein